MLLDKNKCGIEFFCNKQSYENSCKYFKERYGSVACFYSESFGYSDESFCTNKDAQKEALNNAYEI